MEVWRRGNRLVKKLLSKKESFTLYDKRPGMQEVSFIPQYNIIELAGNS